MSYGGIEAGGTKWVCAIGDGPETIEDTVTFPTTTPAETLGRAIDFFARADGLAAIGVGSFGPIDVQPSSPGWGSITTTPKPGWSHTPVVSALEQALRVPIAFDTDVNAAALGEQTWGAAAGLETFCYVTVGTGIGGGVMANGRLAHGLTHPEIGHILIPHDRERDPFAGACPYHGDCFEGLASGESMRRRWGTAAEELDDPAAWELEAGYLASGLVNIVYTLSPERIILGGGVMHRPGLHALVRSRLRDLLAGYVSAVELNDRLDEFVVPPALGDRAGVLGAIELARRAPLDG